MKRISLIVLTIALMPFSQPVYAWETVVNKAKTARYNILALDGTWHDLEVAYSANLQFNEWESGHPSKIKFGDFALRDTRQCHLDSRRNISKTILASRHQETGEEDVLYGPLDTKFSEISATNSEIADKYLETLIYGGLYDFGDTGVEFGKGVVDGLKVLFDTRNPFEFSQSLLDTALELGINSLELLGNSVGRTLGLRTGTNCGEAKPGNNASKAFQEQTFKAKVGIKFTVDPYLSIPNIIRRWKYRDQDGKWVPAIFLLPSAIDIGSDLIVASQYLIMIDLIMQGDVPPALIEELLKIPVSKEAPKIVATRALKYEVTDLVVKVEGVLAEAVDLSRQLNSLVLFSNPFETVSSISVGDSRSLSNEITLLSAMSNQGRVPACLIIPNAGEGHYLVALAPLQEDVFKIRELDKKLNALINPIVAETDRLLHFSNLIGSANQHVYSPLLELQSNLTSILKVSEIIQEHDRRKRRCENQVFLLKERSLSEIIPPSWHSDLNLLGPGPILEPQVYIQKNLLMDTRVEEFGDRQIFEISPELSDVLGEF